MMMQALLPKLDEFSRPGLKVWLDLENIRGKIGEAVDPWDAGKLSESICSYVSTALSIEVEELPWMEVAIALRKIDQTCAIEYDFPFLRVQIDDKKETWDYEGRTWYIWLHMLASEFGWTAEYIADLDVDMAFALAQEIAVRNQLEKEFQWATSEVPYQTKDGFKPLERPRWMLYSTDRPEDNKIKIRKEFMPVGIIKKWNDRDVEFEEGDLAL